MEKGKKKKDKRNKKNVDSSDINQALKEKKKIKIK